MTDNNVNPFYSESEEDEILPEAEQEQVVESEAEDQQPKALVEQPVEETQDYVSEIRTELVSDQPPQPKKKPGFFARLFGFGSQEEQEPPAKPTGETVSEAGVEGENGPIANMPWQPSTNKSAQPIEIYQGYEENQGYVFYDPEDDHLSEDGLSGMESIRKQTQETDEGAGESVFEEYAVEEYVVDEAADLAKPEDALLPENEEQEGLYYYPESYEQPLEVQPREEIVISEEQILEFSTGDAKNPPEETQEPGPDHTPEWKAFLNRFWKAKDEEEEERKYQVSDDVLEGRLDINLATDETAISDWRRSGKEADEKEEETKAPEISASPFTSSPDDQIKINQEWMDQLRQEDLEVRRPETHPDAQPSKADEEDWMAEMRSSENRDEVIPAALVEEDWLAEDQTDSASQALEDRLQSSALGEVPLNDDEEGIKPTAPLSALKETRPLSPYYPYDKPVEYQVKPKPVEPEELVIPAEPVKSGPAVTPAFTMPEDEAKSSSPFLDEEEELIGKSSDQVVVPDQPYDLSGSGPAPVLPEYELATHETKAAIEEAQARLKIESEKRAAIFAKGPEANAPNEAITEIRSETIEGYQAPTGPIEVIQPSTGKSGVERFASWLAKRGIAVQILLGIVILALLAGLIGLPAYFLAQNASKQAEVVPTATFISLEGVPYPSGLQLPGGWYFILQHGTMVEGMWQPKDAEWLDGTELRRVIGLPWNRQTEAVFRSLENGDEIELQLNNGQKLTYVISNVQQVPKGDTSLFNGNSPSMAVFLFQQDSDTRWAVVADLK